MPVIRLRSVNEAEAESLVAEIWRLLEHDCLATPRLTVADHARDLISLALDFPATEDFERVNGALARLSSGSVADGVT